MRRSKPVLSQSMTALTLRCRRFKMFKVSVNFTVKMVIENVLRAEGDACKGWAATEAVEMGGGKWAKVIPSMP